MAAMLYVPVVAVLLIVGLSLVCLPATRLGGKRLLCATVATGPGLAIGGGLAAAGVLVLVVVGGLVVRPWTSNNEITSPLAAGLFAYSMLFLLVAGAALACGVTVVAWQVGWRTPALGFRLALVGHPAIMKAARLAARVRPRVPAVE
jgi:hypothetical protein